MYLKIINNQELSRKYIANDSAFAWGPLEGDLTTYLNNQKFNKPFSLSHIPIVSKQDEQKDQQRQKAANSELSGPVVETKGVPVVVSVFEQQSLNAKAMAEIPQLAALGTLFKSSESILLTESEEEYQVSCIKHIFPSHLVMQVIVFFNSSLIAQIR